MAKTVPIRLPRRCQRHCETLDCAAALTFNGTDYSHYIGCNASSSRRGVVYLLHFHQSCDTFPLLYQSVASVQRN
ncbi:UTP-GlnB uridylyltransferase, GlnD [Anopheles sinensis]|uniref:UTP-GlnB uridylyltransferase, GlnD n=1 Tax=Anopheles sinensis TaxID=74873 RepID=A0A084VZK1_ANOSI|nr:UTP-GlnB uridylyltransferase, GlnD [Anopheles sinensis]